MKPPLPMSVSQASGVHRRKRLQQRLTYELPNSLAAQNAQSNIALFSQEVGNNVYWTVCKLIKTQ